MQELQSNEFENGRKYCNSVIWKFFHHVFILFHWYSSFGSMFFQEHHPAWWASSRVYQVTDLRLKPLWQESKVLLQHLSCYHLSVHPLLHRLVRDPWVRFYSNLGSLLEMLRMTCHLRWITEIAIWVLKCPMCTL